jgi:hypothetical protein
MIVDVLYEGLPLAKGVNAREEGSGAFLELDHPMPVGTRLIVKGAEFERPARVERVHEGVGPGVVVVFVDQKTLGDPDSERKASQVPQASAEPEPDEPDDVGGPPANGDPAGEKKGPLKNRRNRRSKSATNH